MDKLPAEVLKQIFIYLHQKHKVECMTVCKRWEYVIRKTCLFHTIFMTSSIQVESLERRLKDDTDQGSTQQVENFISFAELNFKFDLGLILCLLPNPRFICVPDAYLEDWKCENWSPYLEYLYTYGSEYLTSQLLGSYNYYPRIKGISSLKIRKNGCPDDFIRDLKSTRVLEQLSMDNFNLTLPDLEMIHENTSMLKSLQLINTTLLQQEDIASDVLGSSIEPAVSVTSFTLDIDRLINFEDAANVLIYASEKYPNLEELKVTSNYGIFDDHVEEIFNGGLVPLLQKLGPKLKKLSTCMVVSFPDLLQVLDKVNCRIKDLDVVEFSPSLDIFSFGDAEQYKYIQSLRLKNIHCIEFKWLGKFIALRELNLIFSKEARFRAIELPKLFEMCSSTAIESIRLEGIDFAYITTGTVPLLTSVKNLDLQGVSFCKNADLFISTSLPCLRNLTMLFFGKPSVTFNFSNLHLSCLDIRNIDEEEKEALLAVVTLENNERHYYSRSKFNRHEQPVLEHILKYDTALYPSTKLQNYDLSDDKPLITFICASVKEVVY